MVGAPASVTFYALRDQDHALDRYRRYDEMRQTKASRAVGELLDVAHEWRKAFEAKGWTK